MVYGALGLRGALIPRGAFVPSQNREACHSKISSNTRAPATHYDSAKNPRSAPPTFCTSSRKVSCPHTPPSS
jgi:hypothetical protein